jgi:hypothetical protein
MRTTGLEFKMNLCYLCVQKSDNCHRISLYFHPFYRSITNTLVVVRYAMISLVLSIGHSCCIYLILYKTLWKGVIFLSLPNSMGQKATILTYRHSLPPPMFLEPKD